MKLELKEDMYCRSHGGAIRKIVSLEDFNEKEYKLNGFYVDKKSIQKASFNIIDLIEKGDYVNGVEVINIDNEWITMSDTQVPILKSIANGMIESIVTKEKFEQMAYEVGEQR